MTSREQVLEALAGVVVPKLGKSVVDLGLVAGVAVQDGRVRLALKFSIPAYASKSQLRGWVTQALAALPEVEAVEVNFVAAERAPQPSPAAGKRKVQLAGVGCVLAVFSGKGGVGKSTVSVNLAGALTALGQRVGLFDADMYGPSVPKLLGLHERPSMVEGRILPLARHGIRAMSVGFLVDPSEPLIWRGPMITKGINELLEGTDWGPLDFLILDLPPGTGDAPLGLAQDVRLDGSIAVTTPQEVALADVHRGIATFRKLEVPVWGLIENMAHFTCPHCGGKSEVFGAGGGQRESEAQGIPLLGRLPLDPLINRGGDAGVPIVNSHPQHPASLEYERIATHIMEIQKEQA